jgi:hypothetical protein
MEEDQFCPNCGQPVVRQAPPAPPAYLQPPQQSQMPPAQMPPKSGGLNKMPRWMLFGGIGLLIVICFGVVAVGGYLLVGGQNEAAAPAVDPGVASLQATVIAQQATVAAQSFSQDQPVQQQEAAPQTDAGNAADHATASAPGVKIWFDTSMMQSFRIVPPEELWDEKPYDSGMLIVDFENPDGSVMVFPAPEYSDWLGEMDVLDDLAQAIATADKEALSECIPIPLESCDRQAYNAQVGIQYFGNGSGIRSVSSHMYNDIFTFDNESILYQFYGLTTDQQFYVSVLFDIEHEDLPDDKSWIFGPDDEIDAEVINTLSNTDGYNPSLISIDLILTTLRVEAE